EDRAALDTMQIYRARAREFGSISAVFRLALLALAGVLPVALIGGMLWLWTQGTATPGDIAAAGAVAIRIAQMTGWVSMSLMGIYASIGEVEDGMRTLAAPHLLTDAPDAVDIGRAQGDIRFDDVSFAYGRGEGGLRDITLHVKQGERLGIVGASGAGKSTLVALLLRLYDTEKGRVLLDGQ